MPIIPQSPRNADLEVLKSEMSFELPLFPLNVVLFPRMPLPLHIFEPRYRLLTRRCLEGGHFPIERAFGVTMIVAGQEGTSDALPAEVGCTAQITAVTPMTDGRFNLHTVGGRRFQVLSRRIVDEYWVGDCRWLDDLEDGEDLSTQVARVRSALHDYLRAVAEGAGVSTPDLAQLEVPLSSLEFSMWIAALLPLAPPEKQPLLEMTSTAARLEEEYTLLRRAQVIQRAYSRREAAASGDGSTAANADQFVSLN
jgi:ATP-dependent Lon protease